MPVLEITFPAGRYHATAWGRNVNEGDPEWPPSPFRLARALMDMRYRRFEGISDSELEAALLPLVGTPRFSLPPVSKMAVKCYLDQGAKELDRQPVLDAFVCLGKDDALYMELPEAPAASLRLLEPLAGALPYLGRSESWVTARLCTATGTAVPHSRMPRWTALSVSRRSCHRRPTAACPICRPRVQGRKNAPAPGWKRWPFPQRPC